ncbi:DUF4396 domain-containing protein [Nitrospira sp. NS4]|uniref:DUF4396 domain-containing protein n=1 Tax=Nitrospira sp. NS4 TaxID=3414498 RepID=UPI003C2B42D9
MMNANAAAATLSQHDAQRGHHGYAGGHGDHHGQHDHHGDTHKASSLNRTAFMATVHCLTGCTIGEILGMVIGTALGWTNGPTVALAVALAFLSGYTMTLRPLRRAGMAWGTAFSLAFASDTISMATMEMVDNALMLAIPGAMDAGLPDPLFWGSLILSLVLAGVAAFPVNRRLIVRGKGHALVHAHHH